MACQLYFGPRFHPRSAPVTFWYLVVSGLLTVVMFFTGGARSALFAGMVYHPSLLGSQPWRLITDGFLNYTGPFWLLLLGYIVWWVGAELEQWWGSRVQAGFFVGITVAVGLLTGLGFLISPLTYPVGGLGARPLLCGLFTVWALRDLNRSILLLIVPVSARVLLVLEAAMTWWSYGPYYGVYAVLGSTGLAALYFYKGERFHALLRRWGRRRPPRSRPSREERERERRFREIMERSGLHVVEDDEESL